jgi:hypothetical protein
MPAGSDRPGRRGDDPSWIRYLREYPAYKVSYAHRVRLGEAGNVTGQTLNHAGTDANRLQRIEAAPRRHLRD